MSSVFFQMNALDNPVGEVDLSGISSRRNLKLIILRSDPAADSLETGETYRCRL